MDRFVTDPSANGHYPDLDFDDLKPVEIPVRFQGKRYILREASVTAAVQFRNANVRGTKWEEGKIVGHEGTTQSEPLLVSLCLCETDPDPNSGKDGVKIRTDKNGNPVTVPYPQIMQWPYAVQKRLFDTVKEVSKGLVEEGETEESLLKTIAACQKKIAELHEKKRAGKPLDSDEASKNLLGPTTVSSV